MTSLLPADNPASVKTDSTSRSDFGQISLGTHTVQTVSSYVWVWHCLTKCLCHKYGIGILVHKLPHTPFTSLFH